MRIFISSLILAVIAALVCTSCGSAPAQASADLQSKISVSAVESLTQIAKDTEGVEYDLTSGVSLPGSYTFTQDGDEGSLTCDGHTFKLWVKNQGLKVTRPTGQVNAGKEIYEISIPTADLTGTACYFQVTRNLGTGHYVLIVYK